MVGLLNAAVKGNPKLTKKHLLNYPAHYLSGR